jgi:septal ring factor EnvC (AmiA/AmiB activator)
MIDFRERLKQLAGTLKALKGLHDEISKSLATLADSLEAHKIPREEIVAVAQKISPAFAEFLDDDYQRLEGIFRKLVKTQREQIESVDAVSTFMGEVVATIESETDDGPWWRRVSPN